MIEFNKSIQLQFDKLVATGKLFQSSLTGAEVWDIYINGFTKEENPRFRDPNSTYHNCNLCNNFMRRYGNIVAINENLNIMTMFDNVPDGTEYSNVANKLSTALRSASISNVFFETYDELNNNVNYESVNKNLSKFKLGIDKNVKRYTKEEAELYKLSSGEYIVEPNEIRTFNHLHVYLASQFVDMTGKSIESIMGSYRDAASVFQRAMIEIPLDTLNLVRDLINQGSLLDGATHLYKVEQFIPLKKEYDTIPNDKKAIWCWVNSYKFSLAKFKNELIGVLCTELAEGEELNKACQAWNKRVDPANYMKAVAPITKKQIEEAKKFVEENGYEASFNRRCATIDDIKVSEIKHINVGNGDIKNISIFDSVKASSTRHKRNEFDGVEEVTIDKFMSDILPTCTGVEAMLLNNHTGNMVTLTTAIDKASKPIFKWSNNYSWTFAGNLAGKSMIKEAVKDRGGNVEADVAVRLHFPGTTADYDLHMREPNGNIIYYSNRRVLHASSGMLDLDAQGCDGHFPPEKRVENITYRNKAKMPKGNYEISVNNYTSGRLNVTFYMEIDIEGEVTQLKLKQMGLTKPIAANLHWDGKEFTLQIPECMEILESKTISKEIYGLQTNEFHKVNLICLSPNHWDDNNIGNKHYMFMLDKCKSPTQIRSFHNENLLPALADHRKVLEVLGATTMIDSTDKQLSGLGFNATVKDELIVRLQGTHKRVLKIKF